MKNNFYFIFIIIFFQMISYSWSNHCGHDTDRSWFYTKNYSSKYAVNKSNSPKYARWTFKNKTNKQITI